MAYTGELTLLKKTTTITDSVAVVKHGNFWVITRGTNGISVIDIDTETGDIIILDTDFWVGQTQGIASNGDLVVVAARAGGLLSYSVDPTTGALTRKSSNPMTLVIGVWLDGNKVFACDYTSGVKSFTLNPTTGAFTSVNTRDDGGSYFVVAGDSVNKLLFIANSATSGTNPEKLLTYSYDSFGTISTLINSYEPSTSGTAWSVTYDGDGIVFFFKNSGGGLYAYLSDGLGGLTEGAFDGTGTLNQSGWASGGNLYVQSHAQGVLRYEYTDYLSLTYIETLTDINTPKLGVSDDTIYVVTGSTSGIGVYLREAIASPTSFLEFVGSSTVTFTGCTYEILLPIDIKRETVEIAHRADSNVWNTGKKISGNISDNVIIEIRLGLRLTRAAFAQLETFLFANYNASITVQAPGYDLFDDDNRGNANTCRILGYAGSPVRESTDWYRVDLNLVKI